MALHFTLFEFSWVPESKPDKDDEETTTVIGFTSHIASDE